MRHVTSIRVRYAETDAMAVAYYANYFVWFEVARGDWLRSTGSTYRALEASGIVLPVIEAHCEYRRPARYDDELEIATVCRQLSPVRIEFTYEASVKSHPVTIAAGRTVHAAVGTDGRPRRLPDHIVEVLS